MEPVFWHWLILAVVLVAVEIFSASFVFFWLGVSAALTGVMVLAIPTLGWRWQILVFAILAVASAALWLGRRRRPEEVPVVNRGPAGLVGRVGVLEQGIGPGHGRMRLGDSSWAATGPELPAGMQVRVVSAEGSLLSVERHHPPV